MVALDPATLAQLAKKHLGLPPGTPDECVPRFYRDDLSRHLMLCPKEDNFRVTLQPKSGFGTVTCLKDGCNEVIPLEAYVRRVRNPDGGKSVGFGSLAAYRSHIMSAHGRRRAGGSAAVSHADTASQPSTSQASVKSNTAIRSTVKRKSAPNPDTARVKAERVDPSIPRKRVSDTAFNAERDEEKVHSSSDPSPPKKAKTEAVDKTPFQPVTNTVMYAHASSPTTFYPNETAEDIRAQAESVQVSLDGQQKMMDAILGQNVMSFEDSRRASQCAAEIRRLRKLEDVLNNALSTFPSSSYPTQNDSYYVNQAFGNRFRSMTPLAFQQGPSQPQPFPMDSGYPRVKVEPLQMPMDIDRPRIKTEPLPFPMDDGYYHAKAEPFPMIDEKPMMPIPFHYKQPSPAPKDIKPMVHHTNAVASSSRPLLVVAAKLPPALPPPPAPPGTYSDSDDDDDVGFNENGGYDIGVAHLADPYIGQIGVNIAPIRDENRDDNGDYFGRGKDLFVGPQARSEDLEKFLVEAGNAEAFDGNATVDKAVEYLGLRSQHDRIPGMEVTLMAHQLMGVAWMVEKESSGFNGGCLADEMGLGKTIQMMTVIVKNRSKNPNRKTNLIVAPLALLDQWKQEFEEKTSCGLQCYVYHGSSRARRKSDLMKYDVVLTTFATMASEWPDLEGEMKKKAKAKKRGDSFIVDSDEEDMRNPGYRNEKRKKKAGLLFQVDWYRVVTDEAQSLRNRRTRVSRAASDLTAIYRWCLTGTPIVNTLADAYGYIRFLQIRPWYDWSKFQGEVGCYEKKNPALAVTRLQKITTSFLLRRKKDTELDGKRLIELPEKKVGLIKLEFSTEEREIYKMVEARSQATFNRYLRAGTVLKNYSQVLVLVLRLRQICSHPSLIQEGENAFLHPEEYGEDIKPEFATELTRARRLVSNEFVTKLREKLKAIALERMEAEKNMMDATLEVEDEECPICYDAMTDPVVTSCAHIFCRDCIVDVINRASGNEEALAQRICPVCRDPVSAEKLFSRAAFEPTDKELNPVVEEDSDVEMIDVDAEPIMDRKGKGRIKKPARSSRRKVVVLDDEGEYVGSGSDDDMSDFIVENDEDEEEKDARRALKRRTGKKRANLILDSEDELEEPEVKEILFGVPKKAPVSPEAIKLMPRFLPSTKMKYMMEELVKLATAKPEEKTLIVSQWTGCLALVSDYLTENGIVHVKYQGDMNRTKRDQAVRVFMSREKARVMLMSTKCGGVGLNLTRANNVVSLDLCWSQAIEAQCFDRVHRLGQMRPVRVQRVVIADTVEDRILTLQDRKQALADGTLGEGSGKKIGRLSVKELANLFGLDARGRLLK